MPSAVQNGGLFFSAAQLQLARENHEREPIRSALALLNRHVDDPLSAAYLAALRYQYAGERESAEIALQLLREADCTARHITDQAGCQHLLGWLSVVSMLGEFPTWPAKSDNLEAIAAQVQDMQQAPEPLDQLWQGCLQLAAGIVLDKKSFTERGAAAYRRAIDSVVHPEGYLKGIVDVQDNEHSYAAQVSGSSALVLMAEMAAQIGIELWSYDNRGVTPVTAATYLLYYYYYPEKWKWTGDLTREQTTWIMRSGGAFIEMVHRRHPLRAVDEMLAELRPMFCPQAGGLTTLTHAMAATKKRRWRLF